MSTYNDSATVQREDTRIELLSALQNHEVGMGSDIAVCFIEELVPIPTMIQVEELRLAESAKVYIALGEPSLTSGGRSYFALWANQPINLVQLCKSLSRTTSPVCIAWKAEHAGYAGYVICANGVQQENCYEEGNYNLPSIGVEKAFGLSLSLTSEERFGFPELLLDGATECFALDGVNQQVITAPVGTVLSLLEEELPVEPVLPFAT